MTVTSEHAKMLLRGPLADRPLATVGRYWYRSDEGGLYKSNGLTWITVVPPAAGLFAYGTPALTLGTANAAGSTDEAIRRDATILAFDATVPATQAFGDSAAAGSAAVAARRDHKHAMPATPVTSIAKAGSAAITGAATLTGGTNVTLTQSGNDISIAAASSGSSTTVATDPIWDTKGDIAVATGADAAIKVAVGSQGQVLTATSSTSSGVSWATPAASGSVATDAIWDAAGDLVQGTGADAAARLALGAEGTGLRSTGATAAWWLGDSVLLYDYTVAGTAKASIDTAADTPAAGIAGTSAFSAAYRVLEVLMLLRTDDAAAAANVNITLNGDATSIYDRQRTSGTNATASAGAAVAAASWQPQVHGNGGSASYPAVLRFSMPAYASTTFWKVFEMTASDPDATATNDFSGVYALGYRSTSAIVSLKVAGLSTAKLMIGSRILIYAR